MRQGETKKRQKIDVAASKGYNVLTCWLMSWLTCRICPCGGIFRWSDLLAVELVDLSYLSPVVVFLDDLTCWLLSLLTCCFCLLWWYFKMLWPSGCWAGWPAVSVSCGGIFRCYDLLVVELVDLSYLSPVVVFLDDLTCWLLNWLTCSICLLWWYF